MSINWKEEPKLQCEIRQLSDDTWSIEDGHVRFFLLTGAKEALLIDSGMHALSVRKIAESLTDLPLKLLITHADPDHIANNGEFDIFYMHPAEASNYYNSQKRTGEFVPVEEGDILDLGERPLLIIATPGHTPGSIAVLDTKNRVLISGDPIQDGQIFLFGVQRELHAYRVSLRKIYGMREQFDVIYPSHGTLPVTANIIPALDQGVGQVLAGELTPKETDMFGNRVKAYNISVATLLVD